MKKIFIILCSLFIVLCACKPVKVTPKSGLPEAYTTAYEEIYGRCYDSVPYSVVALDLYSDGLSLDSTHRMQGTGYNLYLSDIFVPDSCLIAGRYTSVPPDSLAPFTFLRGQDYEGTPHGMYLLRIEDSKLQAIQVLDSGSFVMRDTTNGQTDLHFTLYYTNSEERVTTYECHFQGPLIPWQKQ